MRAPSWLLIWLGACGVEAGSVGSITGEPAAAASPRFVQVAAGRAHGCALEAGGRVYCWGLNVRGQLGDGTREPRPRAGPVVGIHDARSLAAYDDRTCVARSDRSVWCWGSRDEYPRLFEDGWRELDDPEPALVGGISGGEVQIGHRDVCARDAGDAWRCLRSEWPAEPCRSEGHVVCLDHETDVVIEGTRGATHVVGHLNQGCAVVEDEVRCWGRLPVAVSIRGTEGAVDVSLARSHGDFACAAQAGGQVSCWGRDDWGQLGLGIERVVVQPQRVRGLTGVTSIAGGASHACALDGASYPWCWGTNRDFRISSSLVEIDVTTPYSSRVPAEHVAAGFAGTCLVRDGALWCTGTTAWDYGPDHVGLWGLSPAPWRRIALPERALFTAMAPGYHFDVGFPGHDACARLESGRVVCTALVGSVGAPESLYRSDAPTLEGSDRMLIPWGSEVCGRTASGWRCVLWRGNPVAFEDAVEDVAAVSDTYPPRFCAVVRGEVRCGEVAEDPDLAWRPVPGTEGAVAIRAGELALCSIDGSGGVSCWGASDSGMLGVAEPVERDDAVAIAGLPPVIDLVVGHRYACGLTLDGSVWCWGHRHVLGDGEPITFEIAQPLTQ